MSSERYFEGCSDVKLEVIVTEIGDVINGGVVKSVSNVLGTDLDRYAYCITLGIVNISGLQDGINCGVGWCVSDWLGPYFDIDSYGITIRMHERIYPGSSCRYFEGWNDVNIEGLEAWVGNGINDGVSLCVASGLGIGLDGDTYGITFRIYKDI